MATNLLNFLHPIFFIYKLSALSHFNFELKKLSKVWVVHTIILVLLMNVLSIYQLNLDIMDESNTKLFKFVSILRFVSPNVSKTSICILFICKYKSIINFMDCLTELEIAIEKGLKVVLSRRCYVKFQTMVIVAVLFAVTLQVLLTYKTTGQLVAVLLQVFNLISLLCLVQFISSVLLLNHYITIINSKLHHFSQIKGILPQENTLVASSIHHYGKSQTGSNLLQQNTLQITYWLSKELIRFIYVMKEDLNSFFSFPLLLIIADSLLLTTFSLYMLIKNMSVNLNSDEFFQQTSYLYEVFLNVVKVTCIAFPCAATDNEVKTTAVLTHQLMNKKYIFQDNLRFLVLLSKQLSHVEMVYTACGFFTLNENLLTSVFAAISTQLVILLQFQMTSITISTTTSSLDLMSSLEN